MKKTNLYYKTVYKRKEAAKDMAIIVMLLFISWPRALVEVFIRKNFGERYFSFFTVIMLSIFLFFLPIFTNKISSGFYGDSSITTVIGKNVTWYLYLAALLYFSYLRQQEIKREPGTFDFAKFSAYDGDLHPFFKNLKIKGEPVNRRQVSIFIEPLFLLCTGILLLLCLQKIGLVIIFCAVCYSVSYYGDYVRGDHFILDTIDEMICNEEMVESFVEGKPAEETRGFQMHARQPGNPDMRRKVVYQILDDEGASEAF